MQSPRPLSGMATPNQPGTPNPTFESKHLHVRPEGVGPAEFHFTFEMQEKRMGNAGTRIVPATGWCTVS